MFSTTCREFSASARDPASIMKPGMFNKSFSCTVTTDANGQFQSSTPVEGPHMFTVHVNVHAKLLAPADTTVSGTFTIAPAAARQFNGSTNESVDLGKWQINKGTSTAVAAGSTNPARPNTQLTVQFDASLA
jgi:hypothetical protein